MYLENISITGSCNAAFSCGSLTKKETVGRPHAQYELFATGAATGVEINGKAGIASPVHCQFLGQPPPPPPPPPPPQPPQPLACTPVKVLGCFNSTTVAQEQMLLPSYVAKLHDHVTLEGCAGACGSAGGADMVAGLRDGNHCFCGLKAALSTPAARAANRPLSECLVDEAKCPCGRAKTRGCSCRCSGNFTESCGDTNRLVAYSIRCKLPH